MDETGVRHELIMKMTDLSRSIYWCNEHIKDMEKNIEQASRSIEKYQKELVSEEDELQEVSKLFSTLFVK